MRAFGALRGFPFFGRNSFRRQQQRQRGNKASQAGGQPLSNGSSTTVCSEQRASEELLMNINVCINQAGFQITDSSRRCTKFVSCLAFSWPSQKTQAMSCHIVQCLLSKYVFTLQSWLTHPVTKAAYTSGSLSLAGDLIAQLYSKRGNHVVCSLLEFAFLHQLPVHMLTFAHTSPFGLFTHTACKHPAGFSINSMGQVCPHGHFWVVLLWALPTLVVWPAQSTLAPQKHIPLSYQGLVWTAFPRYPVSC